MASPIGNLGDISQRACDVLARADLIAAEDTRNARRLLQSLGINARSLVAVHEHNERAGSARILEVIREGRACALLSDAGTPAISDPGARVVNSAHEAGLRVVPVPGCSALATLLSVAGIDADRYGAASGGFWFEGFLPTRAGERAKRLAWLVSLPGTVVLYEAPHRIAATLDAIAAACTPPRELVIGRELTKRFEQVARMSSDEAPLWLRGDSDRGRGEFAIAIAPAGPVRSRETDIDWQAPPPFEGSLDDLLRALGKALPPRQAARVAGTLSGLPSRELYARLVARNEGSADDVEG